MGWLTKDVLGLRTEAPNVYIGVRPLDAPDHAGQRPHACLENRLAVARVDIAADHAATQHAQE